MCYNTKLWIRTVLCRMEVLILGTNVYDMEEKEMDIIRALDKENMKQDLPDLKVGDLVKVAIKVIIWYRRGKSIPNPLSKNW